MVLKHWTELFRTRLNELGVDCSNLYAASWYEHERDPAEAAERAACYGIDVPGVIWSRRTLD
jgi:hypothetical protein